MENKGIAPVSANVTPGFDSAEGFELLQRVAHVFCNSTIVPETFRGQNHMGDAIIAVETAARMHLSPLLVMQNMYIVYGNPAFSSKFLISTFNMCGRFSSIKYKETGKKGTPTQGCIAYATEKATGDVIEGPEITLAMADAEGWRKTNGSKWKTMPEQMLRYRAAAFMIRTTAPEILMGFQTIDEVEDIHNAEQDAREEIRVNANSEVFEPKAIAHDETPKATVPTKQQTVEVKAETVKKPAPKATPKKAEPEQTTLTTEEDPGY